MADFTPIPADVQRAMGQDPFASVPHDPTVSPSQNIFSALHPNTPMGTRDGSDLFGQLQPFLTAAAQAQRDFEQNSANIAMSFESREAELDRQFQLASAREAMAFEHDEAKLDRDFQLYLRNTAYQAAVADLKEAGLNPALAYQQGGAATTSGATASGHTASGSSARGHRATGTKAEVATDALVDIVKSYINQSTQLVSSVAGMFRFHIG